MNEYDSNRIYDLASVIGYKKTDKKMKAMGAKVMTLIKKTSKQMVKKHRAAKQAMMQKKN